MEKLHKIISANFALKEPGLFAFNKELSADIRGEDAVYIPMALFCGMALKQGHKEQEIVEFLGEPVKKVRSWTRQYYQLLEMKETDRARVNIKIGLIENGLRLHEIESRIELWYHRFQPTKRK